MKSNFWKHLFGLLATSAFLSCAYSQTTPAPAGNGRGQGAAQGALGQAGSLIGVGGGAGTRLTVQMIDAVDSSRQAAGQFRATVKTASTVGNLQVPAGAGAVVKLVANGAGAARSFTVELTALGAGAQTAAVVGTSPALGSGSVLAGAGGALGNGTNALQKRLGGLLGRGQQQTTQQTAAAVVPSVTGSRVYLPAGSEVIFTVAQPGAAAAPAQTQVAVAQPAGVTPLGVTPTAGTTPAGVTPAAGVTPTGGVPAVQPGSTAASANTVVYENMQYALQGCQRQAPHVICQIQFTNLGAADAFLNGGQNSYYVDQAGNRVNTSMRAIANCVGFGRCQLLPGVAMAGRFEFTDEQGHATQLIRLQIYQDGKAVAQFTNVPVQ
jgi:hypothetical protein